MDAPAAGPSSDPAPDHAADLAPDRVAGSVARFNGLDDDVARAELLACCSSTAWADGVLAGRPFAGLDELLDAADAVLRALSEPDVDDALAGHPRIGERPAASHGAHSQREQAGVDPADRQVLDALADGNRLYEARFGHVYLVFATGKTAPQMLEILRSRLDNDPATERVVLRGELAKINRLRLTRLLGGAS